LARRRKYGPQVTDEARAGIDLDDAGSAEVLLIEDIQVDEEYQRELRHDLVNKIALAYDIVKAGPILVNKRKQKDGGGLWCIDGQHRMAGALQAGETEIFAHVTHGLSKQEEAELRLARNDRRSDSTFEKFRTRLVMGDRKVEDMVEIARQHGTTLNMSPQFSSGINALVACEALYDAGEGGGVWLGRVLRFLRDTFGEDKMGGSVVSGSMLKAVAWFLDRHPRQARDLQVRLRQVGVAEIDRQARNHKAINGGSQWLNYYRALVATYNHGRQEKNKIEAKTIGSIKQLGEAGHPKTAPFE